VDSVERRNRFSQINTEVGPINDGNSPLPRSNPNSPLPRSKPNQSHFANPSQPCPTGTPVSLLASLPLPGACSIRVPSPSLVSCSSQPPRSTLAPSRSEI
jgi:hypothetical protein